jgi:hypothetical protein
LPKAPFRAKKRHVITAPFRLRPQTRLAAAADPAKPSSRWIVVLNTAVDPKAAIGVDVSLKVGWASGCDG